MLREFYKLEVEFNGLRCAKLDADKARQAKIRIAADHMREQIERSVMQWADEQRAGAERWTPEEEKRIQRCCGYLVGLRKFAEETEDGDLDV
jgi:hypothetical protein